MNITMRLKEIDEDTLQEWIDEACKLSTLLVNIENLQATMERTKLMRFEKESWGNVDTDDLSYMLSKKSKECSDAYKNAKKEIRSALEHSPDEIKERYRMWAV